MAELESLRELFKHPGWQEWLGLAEEEMVALFRELFFLSPTDPQSFVKFVELKGRIDQIRNLTYFYERELAGNPEEVEAVDKSYFSRFVGVLKKIFKGDRT